MTAKTKVNSSSKRSSDQAKARAKAAEPKIVPAPKKNTPAVLVRKSQALQINSKYFMDSIMTGLRGEYEGADVALCPIMDGGVMEIWITARRVVGYTAKKNADGELVERPVYHWAIATVNEYGDTEIVCADGDRQTVLGKLKGRVAAREILNQIASGEGMPRSFGEVAEFKKNVNKAASVMLR